MMPAKAKALRPIRQSILDRLLQAAPATSRATSTAGWDDETQYQASIARDLTFLLNTRKAAEDLGTKWKQCGSSILAYGIPDITLTSVHDAAQQERIRRAIEAAIRLFEPRLSRVVVSLVKSTDSRPVLRLRIDAVVLLGTGAQNASFAAVFEGDSRSFSVSGAAE